MYGLLKLREDRTVDHDATVQAVLSRSPESEVEQIGHLVSLTIQVARMVLGGGDVEALPQHLWLFELAGRLKGGLPHELRKDERVGHLLAPLSLLFVDVVEVLGGLPTGKRRIQWDDVEAVTLEFEEIWYKRLFAKGSPYVDEAVAWAQGNPLNLKGNRYFVLLVNVASYLQAMQPGLPILLPINAMFASKLGTTPVTLGTAVGKAVREGVLEVVDPTYDLKAGRARSFRVNEDHPIFKEEPAEAS